MVRNGLHPGDLIFEITEHALISDLHQSEMTLDALCDLGISIALDDFGTGYSSLNRLLRMPISCVKIDKSIVHNISSCQRNRRLMRGIVEIAQSLGQDIVAEGIESASQLQAVQASGATCGQGFLLGRPAPLEEFMTAGGEAHPLLLPAALSNADPTAPQTGNKTS